MGKIVKFIATWVLYSSKIRDYKIRLKKLKELEHEYQKELEIPKSSAHIYKYTRLLEKVRTSQRRLYPELGHDILD